MQNISTFTLLILLLLLSNSMFAKIPELTKKQLTSPPPRIIRTCCSFGYDMKLVGIPGVKITEISDIHSIGKHVYLGHASEENGIIYTKNGGFIDLAHLRDQADWTAYLYTQILRSKETPVSFQKLGQEGGSKKLFLNLSEEMTIEDEIKLAGRIAYDLSLWHEIATWFGASTIPMVPERYSSFSAEDAYSNLLGVLISMKALKSELPFEEAMTKYIEEALYELDVVWSQEESFIAMEEVLDIWWTNEKRLPNKTVLLQRQLNVFPTVTPWLVPNWQIDELTSTSIDLPLYASNGILLSEYYDFEIRLNAKFPYKKMFPYRQGRRITETDFPVLIDEVKEELNLLGALYR